MKPFLRVLSLPLSVVFSITLVAQQGQSPLPALPADIPKDATIWMLLTDKTPAGQDAVWTTPDGAVHEFFQFNDRGRGPKTYSTYRLDSKRHRHLRRDHRRRLHEEPGERELHRQRRQREVEEPGRRRPAEQTPPAASSSDSTAARRARYLLAQALLKNGGKLPLLPGGEASCKS